VDRRADWRYTGRHIVYSNMEKAAPRVDDWRILVDRKAAVVGMVNGQRLDEGGWRRAGRVIHHRSGVKNEILPVIHDPWHGPPGSEGEVVAGERIVVLLAAEDG